MLRSMLKISYAACPCLSQLVSEQFALEMCLAARNCQKKSIKTPILAFKNVIQGHWIRWQSKASLRLPIVINSNLGPISHSYWDTATYWLKIANFSHPLSFSTLVRGDFLWIYGKALRFLKLKSSSQPDGEDLVILACTVFDWSTRVTDGQIDIQNCDG